MSLTYDKDGFKLSITAGVADEAKGKRRWTRVTAHFMGYPCSTLEGFRRGQLARGEMQPCLGTETEGVLSAVRQKDKVQYLHVQRAIGDRMVEDAYLAHLDAARLEVVVGKALQFLAPASVWGPEP